ncbi:MAG: ankyrin repeat domain-containing protein, partial [Acidobacteriota bacterium]|nr:ankyrin repeat domain-containing protein [Acidobacteriota bacterium]
MKNQLNATVWPALIATLLLSDAVAPDPPVVDAAMRGDVDAVRALLREGADVNAAQGDGMTALHWSAENDDLEIADVLLVAGANVDAVTRLGSYTALHIASKAGSARVVGRLLEAGADPEALTATGGVAALHYAAASGRVEAV